MAYPSEDHQLVVNYWSNPRMVLPKSDAPLGVEGVSDNAEVLTKKRFKFAATGDESGQCWSTGGVIQSPNYPAAYANNLDEVISSVH